MNQKRFSTAVVFIYDFYSCNTKLFYHVLPMGKSEMKSGNTYSACNMSNCILSSKSLNQIFTFGKERMK